MGLKQRKVIQLNGHEIIHKQPDDNQLDSQREKAEAKRETLPSLHRLIFQQALDPMLIIDDEGFCREANNAALNVTGYTIDEIQKLNITTLFPACPNVWWKDYLAGAGSFCDCRLVGRDGRTFLAECRPTLNLAPGNHLLTLRGSIEQKEKQRKLEEQIALIDALMSTSNDFLLYKDRDLVYRAVNDRFCNYIGRKMEEVLGKSDFDLFPWNEAEKFRADDLRVMQTRQPLMQTEQAIDEYGGKCYEVVKTPTIGPMNDITGVLVTLRDISEQKRTTSLMEEQRDFNRIILDTVRTAIIVLDTTGNIVSFNRGCEHVSGYTAEEAIGKKVWEFLLPPEDIEGVKHVFLDLIKNPIPNRYINNWVNKNGQKRLIQWDNSSFRRDDGKVEYLLGTGIDITELKETEQALRESEVRLGSIFSAAPMGIGLVVNRELVSVNDHLIQMTGYSAEELIGKSSRLLYPNDEEFDLVGKEKYRQIAERGTGSVETKWQRKDGSVIDVFLSSTPLNPKDLNLGVTFAALDITERKQAEEAKANLEMQLLQSQKMEAIGRLAGGVAHDFNNLLTGILGYSDMLLSMLPAEDPMVDDLEEIYKAADRAAGLTQQLLAFSRKQIISPKVINLNEQLTEAQRMLGRLIGEDIRLRFIADPDLGMVKADPNQIDQILINLAVNARDAMPQGGDLIIETANIFLDENYTKGKTDLQPGPYVMLAVSDTGFGMEEETKNHLFEPFFTTKALGKGTGLGLSTVYGIVQQNKGTIGVYSEKGIGSTFKIYLPRVDETVGKTDHLQLPDAWEGNETILLVEDEEIVLHLAVRILKEKGYTVLSARSVKDALHIAKEHKEPIHLLLTDVVLPLMNGKELYKKVNLLRPDIKVLFMSGYTENAIVKHGVLEEGTMFIPKPFNVEMLARKVRETLGVN